MNLTPYRKRCLAMLDQRGPMDLQEIGYSLVDGSTSRGFKHPASATRYGGGVIAPLRKAGLVTNSSERYAWRRKVMITAAGRAALRDAANA